MLVSSVQQSDSVIYVLFQMIFQYRLLQDIEYIALCYIVVPCYLTVSYIVVEYLLISLEDIVCFLLNCLFTTFNNFILNIIVLEILGFYHCTHNFFLQISCLSLDLYFFIIGKIF